ncbi:hypothetical protein FCH28_14050 [Streptomyces piniterrae]|uniref:Uncharacterized protein n=1 Tax=Streptomyces piniterrae TaxID=2571125 RepID=A0A4U0NJ23_9ACTN|nr:hypothetical protein [Streptomyces piniterrae]TJZ54285.1 hypothetical protein FCH28_14050 [Streptomyces piniterrae]
MTSGSVPRYDRKGAQLLALLLAGGAPGDAGRIRRRLGEAEPRFLTWVPLTTEARAKAAGDPDVRVRRALARAEGLTVDDLVALLERPDPVVDQCVYEHAEARPWMRRLILSPGRHPEPTALAALQTRIRATTQEAPALPHFVGAAVVSEVPELVEHALRACGRALTTAEQLRAVLQLFSYPERLRALLAPATGQATGPAAGLHPAVADIARSALDTDSETDGKTGGDRLRAAVATAEGPEGMVAGLRAGEAEPAWRRTVAWDAIVTAHQSAPLPEPVVRVLAAHPGCSEQLLADLYRTHPVVVAEAAPSSPALLRVAARTPGHPELLTIAAGLGPSDDHAGLTTLVLDTVAPARTAAQALRELGPTAPLRTLVHRRLGADPRRWATLRTSLSRYKGTLADLLSGIADGTVPEPAPSVTPPALTKPYRFLLYATEPDDLRELLPHLPDELLHALLGKGSLPAHALDTALAASDPRARATIGGNITLGIRDLRRLTECDEPTVNAAVYRNQKATLSLRRAIASGVPRTPGRTELVPLDAELRTELLATEDRFRRSPLITSGDPELVLHSWGSGDWRASDRACRFSVVRVWERGGPDAVRRLLDLPADAHPSSVLSKAAAALEHPDGLERLRDGLELHGDPDALPYEDPDALPAVFAAPRGRNATRRLMREIVHEPYVYDFPRLIAAHHEHTFEPEPIEELLRHEDVDEAIRQALTTRASTLESEPIDHLRAEPYDVNLHGWFVETVERGVLGPERLVDTAQPAAVALMYLGHDAVGVRAHRHAVDLVREHLAGHPEAWVIALNLVGTFVGSLAELITTAANVAGPRPGAEELARLDANARTTDAPAPARTPAPALTHAEQRERERILDPHAALASAHLLRTLVAGAPLPTDPAVLDVLAATLTSDVPGLSHPDWLVEACDRHASPDTRRRLAETMTERSGKPDLLACRQGIVAPSEMVARTPVREMSPLPGDWFTRQVPAEAAVRAARRLVADRLGTDPERWLRALAAMDTADWAERPFTDLLDHGSADAVPTVPTVLTPAGAGLLLHAGTDALAAVLPRLDAQATLTLTERARATHYLPDPFLDHLFTHDDRAALLVLARSSRRRDLNLRLLTVDDPTINATLYGDRYNSSSTVEIRRIVLSRRPQGRTADGPDDLLPLAPELRERLLKTAYFDKRSAKYHRVQVEAADLELVEHALTSWGKRVPLPDHLLAARNTLRHGGPDRLRSLIDRGLLSVGAAKVATKALSAPDPDAVLTARLDKELSTERLVAKLRTCGEYEHEEILDLPYTRDWDVLIQAHGQEPFRSRVWATIARLPDAPDELAPAAFEYWSNFIDRTLTDRGPSWARAAIGNIPNLSLQREEWAAVLDALLERGLLSGKEFVHGGAMANRMLHYLAEASVRQEVPTTLQTAVQDATSELAALAGKLLGTDDEAWQRLFAALTGKDPYWPMPDSRTTPAALLHHASRTPLVDPCP